MRTTQGPRSALICPNCGATFDATNSLTFDGIGPEQAEPGWDVICTACEIGCCLQAIDGDVWTLADEFPPTEVVYLPPGVRPKARSDKIQVYEVPDRPKRKPKKPKGGD